MKLSLTLGSKNILSKFSSPFILMKPKYNDENSLRVELTGSEYQEIFNNNFNWSFNYYTFIYLSFNKDQSAIFENMVHNQKLKLDIASVLKKGQKYVIILGSNNNNSDYTILKKQLKKNTVNDFGMFSKDYSIVR